MLQVSDLLDVLSEACKDLALTNRQKLITLLVGQLEEAERSKQATEIAKSLPAAKVTSTPASSSARCSLTPPRRLLLSA